MRETLVLLTFLLSIPTVIGSADVYLPLLTSFDRLQQDGPFAQVVVLELVVFGRVLLDHLGGLLVVFLHQVLHLFIVSSLFSDEALLLFELLHGLRLHLWNRGFMDCKISFYNITTSIFYEPFLKLMSMDFLKLYISNVSIIYSTFKMIETQRLPNKTQLHLWLFVCYFFSHKISKI